MDPRAETALYVGLTVALITAGLTFYGSGFKLKFWAIAFGLVVGAIAYLVGYAYLTGGAK